MIKNFAALSFGLALCAAPVSAQNTIADLVVAASGGASAGQFDQQRNDYDILLNALQTANLVGAVSDPNADLTVFAPKDRAFIRLANDLGFEGRDEEGAWNFLVAALTNLGGGDPIPVLTDVLLYHVVDGGLVVRDLIFATLRQESITTLQGAAITPRFLTLRDNEPDLPDARVFGPLNVRASNGVIHSVNRVLLPIDLP